ncbi:hypothetical protein [Spongiactinospora sp. TRM90649]|uniref:hypothetical protein n=1 Tax=Spongiactinospora sp. TRM90649 TaxID=3031114 RepID=UPI0023F94FB7|nr:hypothetical protein [Spongiactinospora sp. TRM90649]MDF5754903.1 hypothetical protein [Spongiactinospora sp. TRM90649]
MSVSNQTAFAMSCALLLSAIVPGAAGYLTGRLEALEAARRDLAALEQGLRTESLRGAQGLRGQGRPPVCRLSARGRPAPRRDDPPGSPGSSPGPPGSPRGGLTRAEAAGGWTGIP